jgi:uncharacterized protein (DUF362 family)
MKRRDFIKSGLAAGGMLYFSSINELLNASNTGTSYFVDEPSKVIAVKGKVNKSLELLFEKLGGVDKFIRKGSNVLIKPNVSFPVPPNWGATTHPDVIKKIAEIAIEAGAERVAIIDFPMSRAQRCFEITGINDLLKKMPKLKLIELDKEKQFTEIEVPNGKALKTIKIASVISKFDLLINLPHAKAHTATQASFGFKNLMGLIWDRSYLHEKTDIHRAIAELGTVIKPNLTIIDALSCLTTNGPQGPGKTEKPELIIGSTNMLSADSYACSICNWNNQSFTANQVSHLRYAYELGLGEIDLTKMKIEEVSA